ncbi:MAG TPA: hypothetical protein PLT93_20300 [Phycisphaerae bacterium]|nr:hypothetical protein [Phycisphaerae bacterium]
MALQYRHVLSLGLALVLVAACERPSAVADKTPDQAPVQGLHEAAPARTAEAGRNEAPVRELDGRPIWSSSRRGTAEENAQRAFDRNGEAFGAKNIYIGEFGWPSVVSEQDPHASPEKSLNVIRTTVETALDWGCPYIVYWQLYDNESRVKERPTNDQVRGFYLIKPDGEKALAWDYFYALLHPKR